MVVFYCVHRARRPISTANALLCSLTVILSRDSAHCCIRNVVLITVMCTLTLLILLLKQSGRGIYLFIVSVSVFLYARGYQPASKKFPTRDC